MALAKLSSKHVGQSVDKFTLESLGSEELCDADLRGKVTVLHFWDYRDDPLKEPYGQVGYLEFLHNRRRADGLKVYGVVVDGRLQQERTRQGGPGQRGKLKTFMNLTYPILLDDGKVLKQFDDPRILALRCRWSWSSIQTARSCITTSAFTPSTVGRAQGARCCCSGIAGSKRTVGKTKRAAGSRQFATGH